MRRDGCVMAIEGKLALLFYLPSLGGGGAERLLALLATALARRGHRIVLAVDVDAPENAGLLDPAVEVVRLGANHARATLALARLLRARKPDASLSALAGANAKHFIAAALALRLHRAAQSFHGFAEGEPKRLAQLGFALLPLSSRVFARTIAVSDALRAQLLARFRADPERTLRIHNGFLPPTASPARRDGPPTILACGRLSPDKNYPLLLQAVARMRRADARLVILGEGPERARIEGEVERLGLRGRVSMPGYRDPAPFYAAASCFAITSTREAFGLVVAEALACGLPVVTTASGGPPEVLGGLGAVVPFDPASLAQALDAALEDRGDPEPRRARARTFSMDRCADAYEALFRDIAGRG